MGTSPGDPFADWIFGFAWATILKKVQSFMQEHQINEPLPGHDMLPLFGRSAPIDQSVPFVGPTWMDDLAIGVRATSCEQLVSHMGQVTGFLLDLCAFHCMFPNLKPGKAEWLLAFRGAKSRQYKMMYYGPAASHQLPVLCEQIPALRWPPSS